MNVTVIVSDKARTLPAKLWGKLAKTAWGTAEKYTADPAEVRRLMNVMRPLVDDEKRLDMCEKVEAKALMKMLDDLHAPRPNGDQKWYTLTVNRPRPVQAELPGESKELPVRFVALRVFGDLASPRLPELVAPREFVRELCRRLGWTLRQLGVEFEGGGGMDVRRILRDDPSLGRAEWAEVGQRLLTMVRAGDVRVYE